MRLSKTAAHCSDDPLQHYNALLDEAQKQGKAVYRLDHCLPDIPTPEVYYAASGAFVPKVLAYPPVQGMAIMQEALQSFYRLHGVHLSVEDILITAGATQALLLTMQCILDPGSEVIVPEPFHPNFQTLIASCGGTIRPVFTTPEEGYRYARRELIEPLIGKETCAILCCNPCNPTGTVLTRAEMQLLADIAVEHDLWLVVDEVYRDFVYNSEPRSFAQLANLREHLVVLDSASKRFFISGARVGALITKNRALMAQACKLANSQRCVATMNQVAVAELYLMENDVFTPMCEELHRRRDLSFNALSRIPGVVCTCPSGAFYLMARLPVDDTDLFQTWLLKEFEKDGKTLLMAPGSGFYASPGAGRSEMRISYVLNPDDLTAAFSLLEEALHQYPGRLR